MCSEGSTECKAWQEASAPETVKVGEACENAGSSFAFGTIVFVAPVSGCATVSAEPAASANPIAASQGTFTDSQQSVNECKCIARAWGEVDGEQRTNPRKISEYCGWQA